MPERPTQESFPESDSFRAGATRDPVCGEAEGFLYGLIRPGQKYEIDTVRRLLHLLGEPQKACEWVQIGGTNGKGSTAATLAAVLLSSGRRTGLFTSPHLVSLRERSRIDGAAMTREELAELIHPLRDAIRQMEAQHGSPPSFFEALFALSCLHFQARGVEIGVAEVGLGGRLDATAVLTPRVTALVTVSFDHVAVLGPTLADITREKCGIAKPGIPFLSGVADADLMRVVDREAGARGGVVHHLDREVEIGEVTVSDRGTRFDCRLPGRASETFRTRLVGRHQARNAALAAWMAHRLPDGLRPDAEAVRAGLAHASWPARFEVCDGTPRAVWDAGHNPEGMEALVSTFQEVFPGQRAVVVAGFSTDKSLDGMLERLALITRRLVITRSTNWKASDPVTVAARWAELGLAAETCALADPRAALEKGRAWCAPGELLLMTGSIYLLGELIPLAAAAGVAAPVP